MKGPKFIQHILRLFNVVRLVKKVIMTNNDTIIKSIENLFRLKK